MNENKTSNVVSGVCFDCPIGSNGCPHAKRCEKEGHEFVEAMRKEMGDCATFALNNVSEHPYELLRNLLAVILKDGGHRMEHELLKSVQEAMEICATLVQRTPLTDDELKEEARALCAGCYTCKVCRSDAARTGGHICGNARDILRALERARAGH